MNLKSVPFRKTMVVAALASLPVNILSISAQMPAKVIALSPNQACSFPRGSHSICPTSAIVDVVSGKSFNQNAGAYPLTKGPNGGLLINATSSLPLPGLGAIPTSNTTIKIQMVAQTQPVPAYTVLLTGGTASGDPTFVIGQHGVDWTYSRDELYSCQPSDDFYCSLYWITPWEPVDPFPQQTPVFEDVYYTFTPDGRLTIDMMTPYINSSGKVAYTWQESFNDGGWPVESLNTDLNATTNPSNFWPAAELFLGQQVTDASGLSYYYADEPTASQDEIFQIAVFASALTSAQRLADVAADFPTIGTPITTTGYLPCNTGHWMDQLVQTPCGTNSAAGGPVPANPGSIATLSYRASNFVVTPAADGKTARYSWNAPSIGSASPIGYRVCLNGTVLTTAGPTATTTNVPTTPGTTYTPTLVTSYSGFDVSQSLPSFKAP